MTSPSELPTTDERSYATEWLSGEIRVKRKGECFELVVQNRGLEVSLEITEEQADHLRFLWL